MSSFQLKYGKFKAWIEIDGKELECFCQNKQDRQISCLVASQEGKTFSIHFSKGETKYDCSITPFVDGHKIPHRKLFFKEDVREGCFNAISTSSTTERPFMFAPLNLTDDDAYIDSTPPSSGLGEICLKINRLNLVSKTRYKKISKKNDDSEIQVPEVQKVHEKSKKATHVPHQIAYGENRIKRQGEVRPGPSKFAKVTSFSYDGKRGVVDLIFRYRPLEVLQANGIAPYEPTLVQEDPNEAIAGPSGPGTTTTQVATEVKLEPGDVDDNDDDDDDDDDGVLKALQAEVARLQSEKRKRKEAAGPSRKKVKREAETQKFFTPGEVIDLT